MGIKNRRPSVELLLSWIKQGFGQGEGLDFLPWTWIRDVASWGDSNAVLSPITGRRHHYLTSREFDVHLLAEYGRDVTDIRERYALLPWSETQDIAARLGLRHPIIPSTSTPELITTDLLISLKAPDGVRLLAVCVPPLGEQTRNQLIRQLLERIYWTRRGVTWIRATEQNIPASRCANLRFFENSLRTSDSVPDGRDPTEFAGCFERHWQSSFPFIDVLGKSAREQSLSTNDAQRLLGAAVWQRSSRIDIDQSRITHLAPVALRH